MRRIISLLKKCGLYGIGKKVYNFLRKISYFFKKDISNIILKDETKYFSNRLSYEDFDNLCFHIRLSIHRIEKSLVKGVETISESSIKVLLERANMLLKLYADRSETDDIISETLGIIDTVICNTNNNDDIKKIRDDFIEFNNLFKNKHKDIRIIKKHNQSTNEMIWSNYSGFVRSRHSVREFQNKIIDIKTVEEIIELALLCPSECNRQACKVYYTMRENVLNDVKPDPFVSKDIYNFLIVTVNKSMYQSSEVLQPWIDGGIFVESLIMSIHSKGLACCPFQQIKSTKNYDRIKNIASIPDREDIVALIGFGELKDEYSIIETHRKPISDALKLF